MATPWQRQAGITGHRRESRTGSRLAFIGAGSAAERAIRVIDADGKHTVRLDLAAGSKAAMSPTWSADGPKIAFTAYRDGDRDIWVMQDREDEASRVYGGRARGRPT